MKILRCILGITLLFCLIFTFLFGYKKIGDKNSIEQKAQKNIIVGWQIDCFEGGVGSRRNFLLGVAKDFEKINSDYLIMINSYSQKEANDKLLNYDNLDIIELEFIQSEPLSASSIKSLKKDFPCISNISLIRPTIQLGEMERTSRISTNDIILFKDFYKSVRGCEPSEDLVKMFLECKGDENETN
jgi:hypothetical protein